MKIREVLLAANAKPWKRRLIVVVTVALCVAYTIWITNDDHFGDMMWFEPSEWLTYLIGLCVVAIIAPVGAWIIGGLPPLAGSYKVDWVMAVILTVLAIAILVTIDSARRERDPWELFVEGVQGEPAAPLIVFVAAVVLVFALKAIKWIFVGSPKTNRES